MSAENQKMILLVEDEAITAMVEKTTLEKYGYRVQVAHSGEEAIAAVGAASGIDLILMDINLGAGIDGTEAAAIILEEHDLPVVFLSSHTEPEVVAKTERITSYGYVVKNSSMTVLDASIKMAFKLFEAKTKEREKEKALRESEASYRVLFSGASDGILVADAQTKRFRFANPAICRMMGYTEEEFFRMSVPDIHPTESLENVLAEFAALARGEIRSAPDLPCRRKDGTLFFADISHSAMVLEGHEYHAGFFHDITERKQAEEAVYQSKKDWEECFDSITDIITIHDNDYNIIRANKAGNALLKLPALAEHLKLKCFSFYHGADAPPAGCPSCACLKNGTPGIFELFEPHLNRYLEIRAIPRFDSNSRQSGIIHIVRDITESKRTSDVQRKSELRLNAQYQGMPIPTFTWWKKGKDFELIDYNHAAKEITNGRIIEFVGRQASELYANRPDIVQDLQQCLAENKTSKRVIQSEHFVPGKLIVLTIVPIPPDLVMVHMEDISERKQAEKLAETLFTIAQAIYATDDLNELFEHVHRALSNIIPTHNLFIALLSDDGKALTFPYNKDEKDSSAAPTIAADDLQSLTVEVLRAKQSLLLNEAQLRERYATGRNRVWGTAPKCWLGVPLLIRDQAIGVMAIQDYHDGSAYSQSDVALLESTAGQIAVAIERRQVEEALAQERFLMQALMNNVPDYVYFKDRHSRFIRINQAHARSFAMGDPALAAGKTDFDFFTEEHARQAFEDEQAIMRTGQPLSKEERETRPGRPDTWVLTTKMPLRDAGGNLIGTFGISRDITGRKQAEEEIRRQLAEKETLLREVHHRIKNNIASIGGLISLRLKSVRNPEAVAVLQDAIGRVDSMRLLYDKLLLGEGYKDLSVKNYVESLTDTIVALFPDSIRITVEKRIADFQLDAKRLFPLGLIINELLTNKMKYAFTSRDADRISITLDNHAGRVTLAIQDNGDKLPEGFDIERSRGFGLMLVKMLSQQLGGSFSIATQAGTCCVVEFNA
jgi:PAS domain S-box-containing protein